MDPPRFFPPVEASDSDGLLASGGKLTTEWLLDAYRHGIFPWPASERLLTWWSPDPRPIIELDGLCVSRRLARTCRSGKFTVTCNRDFAAVMLACATAGGRQHGTWITSGMRRAYLELHQLGYAHCVEVWRQEKLVGGLYGVSQGAAFFAESKFHLVTDASKLALVFLVEHLKARGFQLLDIQQLTAHTATLGAKEIPRGEFLQRLEIALAKDVTFGNELTGLDRYRGKRPIAAGEEGRRN